MEDYLYRYISFETFIGMIQSQSLTFVLPETWDDPKETFAFYKFLESKENIYEKMLFVAAYYKTYAQCWTTLSESDAMWRIYSYNNRAVRIKVARMNAEKLDNVEVVSVQYKDDIGAAFKNTKNAYLSALSQKRKAFEHEKEIRLISHYKFPDEDDCERHMKALLAVSEHPQRIEIIENLFPNMSLKEQVDSVCELLNIGTSRKTTKDISFRDIPNFIDGVMVHPRAPEWYVKIVFDYCRINNIPFEGKSELYE